MPSLTLYMDQSSPFLLPIIFTLETGQVFIWANFGLLLQYSKVMCKCVRVLQK